jgi:hypothetical protein
VKQKNLESKELGQGHRLMPSMAAGKQMMSHDEQ